jgi:hypothetical protein
MVVEKRFKRAANGRGFRTPHFSHRVYSFARAIGRLYVRLAQGVSKVEVSGMSTLCDAFTRFRSDQTRLMILFRHVSVSDGPIVLYTIANMLPHSCRSSGSEPPRLCHAHFLYGKDVLNWGGAAPRWAFPRLGGIPVTNTRMDRLSLSTIREALTGSDLPLMLAPEGQVTYHMFRSAPLAPGAAQLAAWAHGDLRRLGDSRTIEILPVGVGYEYGKRQLSVINELLALIGQPLGFPVTRSDDPEEHVRLLRRMTEVMVESLECQVDSHLSRRGEHDPDDLQTRINDVVDAALSIGELAAGLPRTGAVIDRVYRLRYWMMDSFYREDVNINDLNTIDRELADRRAEVAAAVKPYERLADLMEYIDLEYLKPCRYRITEYALNLLDVINRLSGGDISSRYTPRPAVGHVRYQEPINASAILDKAGGRKQGVRELDAAIFTAMQSASVEMERHLTGDQT